jgi:phosphatidylserine/phosphatidylglycerophosphate/cardiolipin synthase-like enzyme
MHAPHVTTGTGKLTLMAYAGGNKVLLAMSLGEGQVNEQDANLAGFAIWRAYAGEAETVLGNRLSFAGNVASAARGKPAKWFDSDKAPFQKFRWIDVPPEGFDKPITYRVKALYFSGKGTQLKDGPEGKVVVQPAAPLHTKFKPAFTRGYIASQAYADQFRNADIRPNGPKTPDFNTQPYQKQYAWLGAEARKALFDFIANCEQDGKALVDIFAYDLDEPDVIAALCRIGKQRRLRAILDNAPLHSKPSKSGETPPEIKAAKLLIAAAGANNVRQGHFDRYQHNKVLIKRDASGNAERVLFGSMNFSVRGIYVQANNIIVVDDPATAAMFAKAFDIDFDDDVKAAPFRNNAISQSYMPGSTSNTAALPKYSVALSPHTNWSVSLGPMAQRIQDAESSVLFAVMEPTGQGPVLASLLRIAAKPTIFSYGTVETDKGLTVQSPNGAMGDMTGFAALTKNLPPPFQRESNGGPGMHIHDKFVVVDFNASNPTVFTGSSNLAAGGEEQNGDSLVMIEDPAIASMYAIEAVAMFDHYHFNKKVNAATKSQPLSLWYPGKANQPTPWWKQYYDPNQIQLRDRCLFAKVPLPAGVATRKEVDWTAINAQASATRGSHAGEGSKPRGSSQGRAKREAAVEPAKKPMVKRTPPRGRSAPRPSTRASGAPTRRRTPR